MYELLIGNKTLYYPSNKDYAVFNTNLDLDIGLAGEFKFDVPVNNPLYDEVGQGSLITILRDNNEYWRGEVREISVSVDKTKSVYCLEDLAWLADESLIPTSITNETYEQRFQTIINAYNNGRPADRQFVAGYLTNVTTSARCTWNTEYGWSILDSLRNCICRDTGYIRVRRVQSAGVVTRYIDIVRLEDYGVQASQPITFGVNLLDYAKKMDMGNFTNVITPYGAETETVLYGEYNTRIAGTTIEDANSVALYGRHAKSVIFEGVTDLNMLNGLAQSYLTRYSQPQITMEINALDLAEISNDSHYEIGDSIHVVADPYGIDQWIYLTKRSVDLQNAGNNKITLSGHITRGTTLTQQSIQTAEAVEDIPSKSSILEAAKKNALAMLLDETQGGHVIFEYHETDGKADYIEAINICDEPTIEASRKRWRFSQNGLGYMYRDNPTGAGGVQLPWNGPAVAMTSDGKINANRILTGKLDADTVEVKGQIKATSGYIGDGNSGWQIGTSSIYNKVSSVDGTAGQKGTYVGVDGIRSQGGDQNHAYVKISDGMVQSNSNISCAALNATGQVSANNISTNTYNTDNGNQTGKTTGAFSVKAYVHGSENWVGLNFMNGILIGISGF